MKSSAKRRRSKAQIKDERKQEEKRKEEIQAKLLAWDDVEAELENVRAKNTELQAVNNVVGQMVEDGIIKQTDNGAFEAVLNPDERVQIQSKRKFEREQLSEAHARSQEQSQSQINPSFQGEDIDVDLDLE